MNGDIINRFDASRHRKIVLLSFCIAHALHCCVQYFTFL